MSQTNRLPAPWWTYLLWSSLLLLIVANAVKLYHQPLQVDVAWYLYAGRQLLAGKRLYVDILENNPPLICFLSAIPNWIGLTLNLDVKLVWIVFSGCIVALPAAFCIYFMELLGFTSGWRRALTGFVLGVLCVVPFDNVFGERDHFAFVALLPLICLAALRIAGIRVSLRSVIFISVWAGIFLALKPYFLIAPALCFVFTFWRMKWKAMRLPEVYIVPALTLLHFLLIVIATPAYFDMARLAAQWYRGYDVPLRDIAMSLRGPVCVVAMSAIYRPLSSHRSLLRLTSLATCGWILSAVLQHKGNDYHRLPAIASAAFLAYLILLDLWDRGVWEQISLVRVPVIGSVLFALIAFYAVFEEYRFQIGYLYGSAALLPILRTVEHERVLFISTSLIAFPVVNETGVEFGSRYPCMWILPGLYKTATVSMAQDTDLPFHDLSTMSAGEHEVFDRAYQDFSQRPILIIVDAHRYKVAMGLAQFDFESYFRRDERIRKLWSEYHELPPVRDFRIYRLNSAPST